MKLYKDKIETFQCDLEIKGAELAKSMVRLVLEFDDGQSRLYRGTLDYNGSCEVKIPALKEVTSAGGKAVLEVIADSTFFTP